MKITVLNHKGDEVLTTAPKTTKEIDNVTHMTPKEIEKEFNRLVKEGYTPINEDKNETMNKFDVDTKEITMIYPLQGG